MIDAIAVLRSLMKHEIFEAVQTFCSKLDDRYSSGRTTMRYYSEDVPGSADLR